MAVEPFGWAIGSGSRYLSVPTDRNGQLGLMVQEENLRCTFASVDLPEVSQRLRGLRSVLDLERILLKRIGIDGIIIHLDLDGRGLEFWSPDQINTPHLHHWCNVLLDGLITRSSEGEVRAALTAAQRYL
ncbi:hypothetical protein [Deinococcus yunweiensis]|uniref:hypothetical protein n=1 Tax=Deinococcus yunweiensis TaxID=367282 RepID=UPI00398EED3C